MLTVLDKDAIKTFLLICKKEIPKGHCLFINRKLKIGNKIMSSRQALLDIGITKEKQLWDIVLELKEDECVKIDFDYNPRMDMNSEIFVFKKVINKKMVYIKLTMRRNGIICISFHESY